MANGLAAFANDGGCYCGCQQRQPWRCCVASGQDGEAATGVHARIAGRRVDRGGSGGECRHGEGASYDQRQCRAQEFHELEFSEACDELQEITIVNAIFYSLTNVFIQDILGFGIITSVGRARISLRHDREFWLTAVERCVARVRGARDMVLNVSKGGRAGAVRRNDLVALLPSSATSVASIGWEQPERHGAPVARRR